MKKIFTFVMSTLLFAGTALGYNTVNISDFDEGQSYTLQDGDILTGTCNYSINISIAQGASVTLDNVKINKGELITGFNHAGLSPLGTCHIYLKGTNKITSFGVNEPGLFLPSGSTVHIYEKTAGSGASLEVRGNGYGPGIGGALDEGARNTGNVRIHSGIIKAYGGDDAAGIGSAHLSKCGEIIIEGGTITAEGGERAAGIGCGYKGKCGNITINGGTVTAKGGSNAAAIGCGWHPQGIGSCGSITIGSGVTMVDATKGSGSPYSIGKGVDATTIGTITIGGTTVSNGTEEAHFIYPIPTPTELKVSDISPSTAVVTWKGASDVLRYELYYMEVLGAGYYTEETTNTSFILSGLKANTEYQVWIAAYGTANLHSAETAKVRFTTKNPEGLEEVQSAKVQGIKVIKDGQLFIEINGKTYNANGVEL